MIDPETHPAGVARQIIDAIGNRLAQFGNHEVVHTHGLRISLGTPRFPCVLEVSHEFLLLRVNRDHWQTPGLKSPNSTVDEAELRVSIWVVRTLTRLAIRLKTVACEIEKFRDELVTDRMSHGRELSSELAHTLGRPPKRRLRIAGGGRFNESLQISEQSRVLLGRVLSTTASTANATGLRDVTDVEFLETAPDGRNRDSRGTRYGSDPSAAEGFRFRRSPHSSGSLVQRRRECFELGRDEADIINHASGIDMVPVNLSVIS